MIKQLILVCGIQGSGKTVVSESIKENNKNVFVFHRDEQGRKLNLASYIKKIEEMIHTNYDIFIIDATMPSIDDRKVFVDICKKNKIPISCMYSNPDLFENYQINVLRRQYKTYGKIFMSTEDIKKSGISDPQLFPISALFKTRKNYVVPTKEEGFEEVLMFGHETKWDKSYINSAIIFDYDGTLRKSSGEYPYPINTNEISILSGRKEKLQELKKSKTLLLGISNQSGIGRKPESFTIEDAIKCFEHTNKLLDVDIDYYFCHHKAFPPVCYCRKPQLGNAVLLVEKYKLNPKKCLYIGDMTTDKTLAERIGFKFQYSKNYF